MEYSNLGIHGQMVLCTSLNARSSQEGSSIKEWNSARRKALCGGMLTASGHEPPSMELSSCTPRKAPLTPSPSLTPKFQSFLVIIYNCF
ncbi:unnamed protein product [Linum tenue]|uniref:Uncharacterized protein n=1 Tax=Linum tenue TaxID=586396 RepID=A0AAV0GS31_9ROSI|nr:unnamed protein product [Linum tenue]